MPSIFKRISKKKVIFLILILIAGVLLYKNFSPLTKNNKTESVKVTRGTLEEKLTISGTIDAEEKVTLRFQTSGRIAWVGIKEGDYVKKYQGIASLDKQELKKKLQKYLNTYMNERWDMEQVTRDDYRDKVLTDTIKRLKEKSQFDLNTSVLDVEIQDLAIQFANLWTPIEGIVTKITSPYAGVNIYLPTQAEFEIVNPKTVYFSASADQSEVTKIYEGLTGELMLDAYSDTNLSGSVKNISFIPKAGETGTVYAVKFTFIDDNSNYKYRIGMAGDLTFITERKEDVLYLPAKFVKEEKGKKYVKISKNKKEEKTDVLTGMETDDSVEIISGLSEGETVYN